MKSRCIYCESDSYGTGCMYSPTNVHVHTDNPGACIYCGSDSIGSGCGYNPYSKVHVKSSEFLNRSAIQTENAALLSYFLNVSSSMIEETCKDSPLNRLYNRVSSFIASSVEPFLNAFVVQESPSYSDLKKEDLITCIEMKKRLNVSIKSFKNIVEEYNLKLPKEIVEKVLLDAIIDI